MIIYDAEKSDGISLDMLCKGSITYASCIEPIEASTVSNAKSLKSVAAYSDKDLYYVQSILVSSNWNKNDDIFDKVEVWAAKNTPEDKPTNLEHDEHTIIGHIVSNWPVTIDGELIEENIPIQNLPDKFHIMTASVIYKGFTDPILRSRSEKLIEEIENGTKYVSMECFFNNFDYGLINQSTGQYKILNRNHDTAYLTKYLRAYGGRGEFENHKIGRVLRNITFSGKGFVDKPANSDSIIFTKNNLQLEKNEQNKKIGVFDNQTESQNTETDTMAENATATEQVSDLETTNQELLQRVEALEAKLHEATSATESAIKEHEKAQAEAAQACEATVADIKAELLASHNDQLEAAKQELITASDTTKAELCAMYDKKIAEMQDELNKQQEIVAQYKKEEEDRMIAEMLRKRMASLLNVGLSQEDAEATLKTFESLEDAQFDSIVATLKKVSVQNQESQEAMVAEAIAEAPASETQETSEEATDSDEDTSEAAEILDEVKVEEEVNLAIGGEEVSEAENTRAALVDFVYSRLGKK